MSDEDLTAKLATLRDKRGYLLPHHGLLALTAPALLTAYDAVYTAMTLDDRVLSHHDREFVWLGILIATDEEIATHHIAKFRAAGGSEDEIRAAVSLTATVCGFRAYHFAAHDWAAHLGNIDFRADWNRAVLAAGKGVGPRLCHLTACAIQICNGAWDGLRWQLDHAYAAAVPEAELAEAISLTMFPGSVPYFVTAAGIWKEMIAAGELPASDAFRIWANMPGQGGHGSDD
ncbi:carboxymuconolactone decarboxylase family protein [Puniceibacterium sp. IMCC21224]|uniref:carboxymuconolactone decarboxylase family protein n=1 Tax=Puniceibacterium sp. IMCC21224 TaxID=1618204 RepID=UPI00064DF39C|nr:carboxymuconolactone decarboxylase family protein [Puniceibacterium sp. IMCC21224]KMK64909.1 carboxymuconolactone decarboxylase family protein [Puniceibacterium sp. IMCC21224]